MYDDYEGHLNATLIATAIMFLGSVLVIVFVARSHYGAIPARSARTEDGLCTKIGGCDDRGIIKRLEPGSIERLKTRWTPARGQIRRIRSLPPDSERSRKNQIIQLNKALDQAQRERLRREGSPF